MTKEFNKTIKFLKNNKASVIKTIVPIVMFCLLVNIIGILLPKPNDNITPSNRIYLFENSNPRFNVSFGKQDNPDTSYVRFEAKADSKNPFDERKSTIWNSFTRAFTSRKGFEFGLSEIRFSETDSDLSKKLIDQIGSAIEQMEVKDVKTNTEVIEVGRLLGEEDENNVSKKTVLNKDVYPGIDVEYQILEDLGVKEEIIIQNIDEYTANCGSDNECLLPLNEFVFDLKLDEGVSIERYESITKEENTPTYYLVDDNNNYIAHFLPTFAVDGVGSKTYAVDLVINHIEENNYEVVVTMNLDWLFSNDRVFPIRIDPSIVHDTTTEFDTGSDYNTEVVTGPRVKLQEAEIDYLDSDVVGYWKMDEASGSGAYIEDSSTNSNNGTPTGTTYVWDAVLGGARSFNGSSDYISTGTGINLSNSSFTIGLWAKRDSIGAHQFLVTQGTNTTNNGLHIGFRNTNVFTCAFWGNDLDTTAIYTDSDWHHWACTYDASTNARKIYRDGIVVASDTATADYQGTGTFIIGGRLFSTYYYFPGDIDEVRVSDTARSASEIERLYKIGYEQKIAGIHTSASLDMANDSEVESITWSPVGNHTGGGEIPYSTTGLVGEWNFNETSGTTADNEGSCGSSCDGTLTSFSTTTGQDVAVGSGWTSDNRRWGSGGLMFDGTNDYVTITDNGSFDFERTDSYSISFWAKTLSSGNQRVIAKMADVSPYQGYEVTINSGLVRIHLIGSYPSSYIQVQGYTEVADGNWHHIVVTYDGSSSASGVQIYVDGVADGMNILNDTLTTSIVQNAPLTFGVRDSSSNYYFDGTLDSVSIYERELSPSEILSNYQSGNIEMRYRTSDDGSTWDDWNGGTETVIEDFENEYLYDTDDSGLVAYYPMDESSGTGAEDVTTNTNNGTATGAVIVDGKNDNGRGFDGVDDYINIGQDSSLDLSSTGTISAWVKTDREYPSDTTGTKYRGIISKTTGGSTGQQSYFIDWNGTNSSGNLRAAIGSSTGIQGVVISNFSFDSSWTHIVYTFNGSQHNLYVNGSTIGSPTTQTITAQTLAQDAHIGRTFNSSAYSWEGEIDEVRVYNRALSSSEIERHWLEGSSNPSTVRTESISNSMEGDKALSIESNGPSIDSNTEAHWRLDESSGTGAYIKDSSSNGNDGTPTGTTYAKDGKIGGARSFNGSTDYIDMGNFISLDSVSTNTWTVGAWFNWDETPVTRGTGNVSHSIVGKSGGIATGGTFTIYNGIDTSYSTLNNYTMVGLRGVNTVVSPTTVNDNKWHHVAVSWDGTTARMYFDGQYRGNAGIGTAAEQTQNLIVGSTNSGNSSHHFEGLIDEVYVSDTYQTIDQIRESYVLGKNKYVTKSIDDTDLSANTTLPFWIASDQIGENMELTYGESPYANYQPDDDTVGYWDMGNSDYDRTHKDSGLIGYWDFQEASGSGAYLLDKSGTGNHGTPTGTTYSAGTLQPGGGLRIFNGTSDLVTVGTTSRPTNSFTVEAWFLTKTTHQIDTESTTGTAGTSGQQYLFGAQSQGTNAGMGVSVGTNGISVYELGTSYMPATAVYSGTLPIGWNHVIVTYTSKQPRIYLNGSLVRTGLTSPKTSVYAPIHIGGGSYGYLSGSADEIAIYNWSMSATQVAERYSTASSLYLDVEDSSAKGNDGASFVTQSVGGKVGSAKSFNGSSDYIIVEDDDSLDPANITLDAWIKPDTLQLGYLFYKVGSDLTYHEETGYSVSILADGRIQFLDKYADYMGSQINSLNSNSSISVGEWSHVLATANSSGMKIYINGMLDASNSTAYSGDTTNGNLLIGGTTYYYSGYIDEARISSTVRTSDEIRQAYEIGKRTHAIKVDFKASLQSTNLITGSTDASFTISEQDYATSDHIENIDVGEKIIVKENVGGTQYIAQGELVTVNTSTGAVTVSSWDSGSTFPTSGFTVNATLFKWQREYVDIRYPLDEDINGVSTLTFRKKTDVPSIFWVDDARKASFMTEYNSSVLESPHLYGSTDTDLIAYYPMDETSGTTVGDIARENNGTVTGTTIVDGYNNKGRYFNGSDQFVNIEDSNGDLPLELREITGEITVSAWVKPTNPPTGLGRLVASTFDYDSNSALLRGWSLGDDYGDTDEFDFKICDSSGNNFAVRYNGFFSEYDESWVFVMGVFKPSEYIRLYIDGELAVENTTSPVSNVAYATGIPLRLGHRADNSNQGSWEGNIDEVRIYDRALTTDEVSLLYNTTSAQYIQYQPIFTKWDDNPGLDLYLTEVAIGYSSGPTMDQIMRHGKWFDSSGVEQPFWWVSNE